MSFSLADTWDIWDRLPTMTIEQVAEYADAVVRENAGHKKFCAEQSKKPVPRDKEGVPTKEVFWRVTTTSFGNLAYMALHAPTTLYREKFMSEYEALRRAYARYNRTLAFRWHVWWQKKQLGL